MSVPSLGGHRAPRVPVPAALGIGDGIMVERVDDELVVLDLRSMHYHTLNAAAAEVWQLCDGRRSVADIAADLQAMGVPSSVDTVALAVAELGEAKLLAGTPAVEEPHVNRRRVLKLAAAGVIGAAALPAIQSITVPQSASAQTQARNCCTSPCTVGVCVTVSASTFIVGCNVQASVCADLLDPIGTLAAVQACVAGLCD